MRCAREGHQGHGHANLHENGQPLGGAHRARMGVCTDTCHLYAAGYDLVRDFDGVWSRFDDVVGRVRLRAIHLNDSKTPFSSRRDRHELIGDGTLGPKPFRRIVSDERFASVPKVIETPKLDDATKADGRMLTRLRAYRRGALRRSPR